MNSTILVLILALTELAFGAGNDGVYGQGQDPSTKESFYEILKKLAELEARDKEREKEITELRKKADQDRMNLQQEINSLKSDRQDGGGFAAGKILQDGVQENENPHKSRVARMENEHRVAFFASVTPHDVLHLGSNQAIKFDNAVVNTGNAYHPSTGIFIAPVNGTYSFSATVYGRNPSGYIYFALEKNNKIYAQFEIKINQQVSQTVILNLSRGDEVCVKSRSSNHDLVGSQFTTFSGFLLYERYGPTVQVIG